MNTMNSHTAKTLLRKKGWGWKRAAEAMGYSYTNVAHILTGRRPVSRPFVVRLKALPPSPVPYKSCGFAAGKKTKSHSA